MLRADLLHLCKRCVALKCLAPVSGTLPKREAVAVVVVVVQVSKLQGEVGSLRAGAGLAEELGAQLGAARGRLAEAQRSVEQLGARVGALEEQLREEQKNRWENGVGGRGGYGDQLAGWQMQAYAMRTGLNVEGMAVAWKSGSKAPC